MRVWEICAVHVASELTTLETKTMKLAHRKDCKILRGRAGNPGFSMVIDCEGDEVFSVPESWTDDQVWRVLDIANMAYGMGCSVGRRMKASEIKQAIESA
jgi:hypothetical protein